MALKVFLATKKRINCQQKSLAGPYDQYVIGIVFELVPIALQLFNEEWLYQLFIALTFTVFVPPSKTALDKQCNWNLLITESWREL